MTKVECLSCHQKFPLDPFFPFCPRCQNPVFLLPSTLSPKTSSSNSQDDSLLNQSQSSSIDNLSLGESNTPLLRLSQLEKLLGLSSLWAKNEGQSPTGTFKDRGSIFVVRFAPELGFQRIGTVSVGNMAASTAAYGQRAGLETYILVRGDVQEKKLDFIQTYNPHLIQVEGDYGELFEQSYELGRRHNIYFANSVDPFRLQGYQTIAKEILNQLAPKFPEVIVAPVSSGGHLLGIIKAFLDLNTLNTLSCFPVFIGVQSDRCAPLAEAYSRGEENFQRMYNLPPVPYAISNPNPPAGNLLLKLIYQYNGYLIAVNDQEIQEGQKLLAQKEGIYVLPSAAATLAGFIRCQQQDPSLAQKTTCLIFTGTGFRGQRLFPAEKNKLHHTSLDHLDGLLAKMIDKKKPEN